MPVAVENVVVYENRRFARSKGTDFVQKDREIPVVCPDRSIGDRDRRVQKKECSRIQDDHYCQDRQTGLSAIPVLEFVPDMEDRKGCEDEESREENEDIPRVMDGKENQKVKH